MTEATVTLVKDMQFVVETGTGHSFVIDTHKEVGGNDTGARPLEIFAAGLAGCTGMDVISLLRKMRQSVFDLEVKVTTENAEDHPKRFEAVHITYTLRGHEVDEDKVRKAIQLSQERYCPAVASLRTDIEVRATYTIIDIHDDKTIEGSI